MNKKIRRPHNIILCPMSEYNQRFEQTVHCKGKYVTKSFWTCWKEHKVLSCYPDLFAMLPFSEN